MDEQETCGMCAFYREVTIGRMANGIWNCASACVLDVYRATNHDELAKADLMKVGPYDGACGDFKEDGA